MSASQAQPAGKRNIVAIIPGTSEGDTNVVLRREVHTLEREVRQQP